MKIKKNFFQNKSSKKILTFLIIILFIFSTFIPVLADINFDNEKQETISYEKTSETWSYSRNSKGKSNSICR